MSQKDIDLLHMQAHHIEDLKAEKAELLDALRTMLVATDSDAPLPEGHPGHEAYLNVVAKPRAKQAIAKAEGK